MSRDLPPLNALRAFEATARLSSVSPVTTSINTIWRMGWLKWGWATRRSCARRAVNRREGRAACASSPPISRRPVAALSGASDAGTVGVGSGGVSALISVLRAGRLSGQV